MLSIPSWKETRRTRIHDALLSSQGKKNGNGIPYRLETRSPVRREQPKQHFPVRLLKQQDSSSGYKDTRKARRLAPYISHENTPAPGSSFFLPAHKEPVDVILRRTGHRKDIFRILIAIDHFHIKAGFLQDLIRTDPEQPHVITLTIS